MKIPHKKEFYAKVKDLLELINTSLDVLQKVLNGIVLVIRLIHASRVLRYLINIVLPIIVTLLQ